MRENIRERLQVGKRCVDNQGVAEVANARVRNFWVVTQTEEERGRDQNMKSEKRKGRTKD